MLGVSDTLLARTQPLAIALLTTAPESPEPPPWWPM